MFIMYLMYIAQFQSRIWRATTDSVPYKSILPSHTIESWSKIMSSLHNREEIVKFLVYEWYRSQLVGKTIYVTEGTNCWKITEIEFGGPNIGLQS